MASQKNGSWGAAGTIPALSGLATAGQADVTGLSCANQGSCGLVGDYYTTSSQHPFVVTGSIDVATDTTISAS